MKLDTYLQQNGISYSEFARRIGTPHARTVSRYAKGDRIPSGKMMAKIMASTEGAVQPPDFLELDADGIKA